MSDSEFSNSDESLSLSGDENDFIDVDRLNYEDIDDPYEADPLPQQRGQQVEVVDDIQPIDFRCMCSHCSPQEVDEYVCCMAVDRVVPVVNGAGVRCITQHVLFPDFCTRRELLIVNGAPYRRHSRELRPSERQQGHQICSIRMFHQLDMGVPWPKEQASDSRLCCAHYSEPVPICHVHRLLPVKCNVLFLLHNFLFAFKNVMFPGP
ncbi:uncharacterized protein LOC135386896 [Ornithodoros turicata]|uniref:uncharacterized protein LOC135386896 n=1 Tax=Ornithodoros turicata TaxID=34597 RepID=UPI0031398F6E